MRPLVVVIRSLTLVLLSSLLLIVEVTWQEPLSTPVDWAVFSVNSNSSDESEFPDETPIHLSRLKVFGKPAPANKARCLRLRAIAISPLKTPSHFISYQDLFRREAVLRI